MAGTRALRNRIAQVVLGGWVLLSSSSPQQAAIQQTEWDEVGNYPTAFKCEAARREEAIAQAERQAKGGKRTENAALDAMLRYRCKYTDHPQPRWRRWVRKVGKMVGG